MNAKPLVVVFPLLVAAGCSQSTTAETDQPPTAEVAAYSEAVAAGGNAFATDLYARLSDKPGNMFFSPYSISTAVAMAYAGAGGETADQMAKVLHFPPPTTNLPAALKSSREKLTASKKDAFELRIANRLWGQKDFRFLPAFLQVTKADFGAELGLLDFKQAEAARKTINTWIEQQTNDKIQDLLAPGVLSGETRLVLTNAIYFKARWKEHFSPGSTMDAPFHLSESKQIAVPTMHQTKDFHYGKSDDVQILELPYVGDGNLCMLILLPSKIDGLADLEKELTSENLQKWTHEMASQEVDVYLPKFKMTSEFSLADTLAAMGMPLAFSAADADFSKMTSQERLFISAVIHKAFVDVNEEGTEAAAATAIGVKSASMRPPVEDKLVEFRADHPFVFAIRDNRANSILFLGRVVNPKE